VGGGGGFYWFEMGCEVAEERGFFCNVRVRHERSNRVVRSIPFLRENGIHLDRTLRFPYSFLENNVLILDLRTAVTCGKGSWKKIKR